MWRLDDVDVVRHYHNYPDHFHCVPCPFHCPFFNGCDEFFNGFHNGNGCLNGFQNGFHNGCFDDFHNGPITFGIANGLNPFDGCKRKCNGKCW